MICGNYDEKVIFPKNYYKDKYSLCLSKMVFIDNDIIDEDIECELKTNPTTRLMCVKAYDINNKSKLSFIFYT